MIRMTRKYIEFSDKTIEPPFTIIKPGVSEKEFFEFATEDISCELIEGVLVIHSPASLKHESIFGFLFTIFNLFLKRTDQGKVIGSRFFMRLGPTLIFEPDLLVVLPSSYSKLRPTYLDGPSDFLIEILSPSTQETDLTKKIPYYLEKGVKEIWVIDPTLEELTVFMPKDRIKKYTDSKIVKSMVIKGFWIKLEWLWNIDNVNPLDCFNEILKQESI